jgi:hypothetical protein
MPCDFFKPSRRWLLLPAWLLVAGCAVQMPLHHPAEPAPPATEPMVVVQPTLSPNSAPPVPLPAQPVSQDQAAAVVVALLAYADRVRGLSPAELAPELARLSNARLPSEQLALALALAQLRQTPELIRAQDMLTRLLANASPEAMALHPLARLLAHRFGEQRRFEDALDKQTQQTRETQRRLEQTTERLEALKAIERSLGGQGGPNGRSPLVTAPSRSRNTP